MKVYAVHMTDYDYDIIQGVYLDREKAEVHKNQLIKNQKTEPKWNRDHIYVEEYDVIE